MGRITKVERKIIIERIEKTPVGGREALELAPRNLRVPEHQRGVRRPERNGRVRIRQCRYRSDAANLRSNFQDFFAKTQQSQSPCVMVDLWHEPVELLRYCSSQVVPLFRRREVVKHRFVALYEHHPALIVLHAETLDLHHRFLAGLRRIASSGRDGIGDAWRPRYWRDDFSTR